MSCNNLKEVSLNGIMEISNHIFDSCKALIRVSIPSSVKIIKEGAFADCCSIKHIAFPNSVETIEDAVFYGCSAISSIELPDSIHDISHGDSETGVFAFCKNLSVVTLNSFLPSLREFDFKCCENLSRIIVPKGDKLKYKTRVGKYYSLIVEKNERGDDLPF